MNSLVVILDPEQRQKHIEEYFRIDGMTPPVEDVNAAYCSLSLTCTPEELKPVLLARQEQLKNVLAGVGITAYSPADNKKYNPDLNRDAPPTEIYSMDSWQVAVARYFVGHHLTASTGFGNEAEKAKNLNRISVVMMDKNVRISRMQPTRAVYLQYDNFEAQAGEFTRVFEFLKNYEPGAGLNAGMPVLLGFEKISDRVIDLEMAVYKEFPALQYRYNGNIPIAKLRVENPGLFYELKGQNPPATK